jgi:putative membrane protein
MVNPLIALLLLLTAGAASAHPVATALEASASWGAEPWLLACLALSLLMYVVGASRLHARSRLGRPLLLRQMAYFGAGWTVLAAALASPLDAAGSLSFAAHMVQHELLMIVAAPLLVMGRPLGVWLWAWPAATRRGGGGLTRLRPLHAAWAGLTRPLNAWVLHFAALWLWHVPALFQLALLHPGWHALQHASFLFPALLFWWSVLGEGRAARANVLAYLFTTMLHTGALGALFALSATVWYPAYGGSAAEYGLSALEDQQLGGLIMWVPGGLAYLIAALLLCAGWLAPQPAAKVKVNRRGSRP